MKKTFLTLVVFLFISCGGEAAVQSLDHKIFGRVFIYNSAKNPQQLIVLVSGMEGWTNQAEQMAQKMSTLDAAVVGVDLKTYFTHARNSNESCLHVAAEMKDLTSWIIKYLKFSEKIQPTLVGYGAGATLVYAALAESEPDTFLGAISLSFCPDLSFAKSFCTDHGLESTVLPEGRVKFFPAKKLEDPWLAIQGSTDTVCTANKLETYVKDVPQGDMVVIAGEGHEFYLGESWWHSFKESFRRMIKQSEVPAKPNDLSIRDLPLIEIPAKGPDQNLLAILISGDGGWAGIDRTLSKELSQEGIPVVGLNSLKYFWKKKTPDQMGKDLERIIRAYLMNWKKEGVVLVGYSRGADVLPFMVSRLPDDLLGKIPLIALLGLESKIDFEIHASDIFDASHKTAVAVKPEMEKLKGRKILCIYGSQETDSLCKDLPPGLAINYELKGGHHFGGDYKGIAIEIIKAVKDR